MRHIAPENDYGTAGDPSGERPGISVVIPVFNRVALLARTLAGLAAQQGEITLEVIVVDDGSDEDVGDAVASLHFPHPIDVVRRHRSGYGAGAARNLGAARASHPVVLFLDADCLPSPSLVGAHARWHGAVDNLVVVGTRRFVDTSHVPAGQITAGLDTDANATGRTEWRDRLIRRTSLLRHGDEAFRAVLSGNMSLHRELFARVGGFDEDFTAWGGEDTELGWRLSELGAFVVPEPDAMIFHQDQEDEGASGWRDEARSVTRPLTIERIPHRFYRKDVTVRHRVPKASIVVAPAAATNAAALREQLVRQRLADWEAFFPLDPEVPSEERLVTVADQVDDDATVLGAIEAASGQYLVVVSGHASLNPRSLDQMVSLMDDAPRAGAMALEAEGGWPGLPALAMARRREWAKVLPGATDLDDTWHRVAALSWMIDVPPDVATIGDHDSVAPPPPLQTDQRIAESIRRGGPVGAFLHRVARTLRGHQPTERAAVRHEGDKRSADAVGAALPWADLQTDRLPAALVVGGGIEIDDDLVDSWRIIDRPRMERIVIGASVAARAGETTARFLESCLVVAVEGLEDVDRVRATGFEGSVRTVGHPADGGGDDLFALLTEVVAP